ncbi:SDR family NAD(P)-dependent oxidoreductase [Cellulomonas xiejunii]|uniref:SDR family oxidoreductase n=1 Tax=Cellulomonas xiejunii TaxID=2968083 RepID=A0ABY5KJ82_9CELL|nr:SDR family oxidoreductase [Cellulomonas xiejunii]MCC2312906.1 SDR family oxidoreductase [Cellulomonas xiejunii]MCC2320224.1 SDR family oxidoreductase [Cellulomonas xiejunii]UUI70531.1 SDR family oxidoreductase [Cellulomonas xiejunii]
MTAGTALVVGGYGALGSAISDELVAGGWHVLRSSRSARPDDPRAVVIDGDALPADLPRLDAVVWAQGVNVNDSVDSFDDADLARLLDVNVVSVASQLRALVTTGTLAEGAGVVVVSSIWEQLARPGKFSYTVTKAAVGGLVRAAALDLAPRRIRVNGVLPGVVDTPMSREMLSTEQVASVERATGAGRMVAPRDVAGAVCFLLSAASSGMSGQSVTVDLGFSVGRVL